MLEDYAEKNGFTGIRHFTEPIIDQETFDNVQRIRGDVRRYPDGWGEAHPLTGLMYCADCGSKMYVHRVNNGKRVPMYAEIMQNSQSEHCAGQCTASKRITSWR